MTKTQILTTEDLKNFVVRRSNEHWNKTRQALLLTKLGMEAIELMEDKAFIKKIGGLKSFIEAHVPELKVISHTTAIGKQGIVPAEADIPEDTNFLFRNSPISLPTNRIPERINFHPSLWNAFKNPLQTGYTRFWSLTDANYTDIPAGQAAPNASAFEIPAASILGKKGPLDAGEANKIRVAIEECLNSNHVDLATVSQKKFPSARKEKSSYDLEEFRGGIDFGDAINKLSKSDQARISIPLDIVLDLLKAR